MNNCEFCGEPIDTPARGHPKRFCSPLCRLRAFRTRESALSGPGSAADEASDFRFSPVQGAPAIVDILCDNRRIGLLLNRAWNCGGEDWVVIAAGKSVVAGSFVSAQRLARNLGPAARL